MRTGAMGFLKLIPAGYRLFKSRGLAAVFSAALRLLAGAIDSPTGIYLPPNQFFREGPRIYRQYGFRALIGAALRQIAAVSDPMEGRDRNPVNAPVNQKATRYLYTYELTRIDGVVPSRRPTNETDFALEVPFAFDLPPCRHDKVAAIIHAFYPEIVPELFGQLRNIPCRTDLFISTDTEEKRAEIVAHCAAWDRGSVDVRVCENRGRDVAPKLITFKDVYDRYDVFLHLHTKRSPHGGTPLSSWRHYLTENLIGSPEIARSNLYLLEDPKMGIVFPQHLFDLRGILNWGYDYNHARALLARMGIDLNKNLVLEFPSGSMFWGRSAAIRKLLDLDLQFSDFPSEAGQIDGTPAHAIERVILMIAEASGYEWAKVVRRDLYPIPYTVLPVNRAEDIPEHRLRVFQPCLARADWDVRPQDLAIIETRPILSYPSRNPRPRLTLLTPTVNPGQIFGGVATALKMFNELADELGGTFDRRIVTTEADIAPEGYASFPDYVAQPFFQSRDEAARVLVDANDRAGGRLDLRARDVFFATAWWTANLAHDLIADQKTFFERETPLVYLIQDDEPYFYGWSSKYALAEAAYHKAGNTLAIINSEELFKTMVAKYRFRDASFIPYRLNARVDQALAPQPRERRILIYGRPTVSRNVYEVICEALFRWQQREPVIASRWRIVSLGESFDRRWTVPVQNMEIGGKASLEDYADHLNRAAVGISLMISPHPSYPPLEMAEAGVLTITNEHGSKDLSRRFPEMISIDHVDPELLAQAIAAAVAQAEEERIGNIVPRRKPLDLSADAGRLYSAKHLAEMIRADITADAARCRSLH
jgi:O-antigen biosynthesis protein